ncbi:hypothetical protein [Spiribacter pallidus]|uniref:Uncharacterized protein n=1 Tax=Spiribacter pallidus TaxID=1987936 RepID=A0ABV3TD61_9GAMM
MATKRMSILIVLLIAGLALAPTATAQPPVVFPQEQAMPRVLTGEAGRMLSGPGDRILAHGLAGRRAQRYYLLRPGPPLETRPIHRLQQRLSILVGTARVLRSGEPALLRVESAQRAVRPGDALLAIVEDRPTPHGSR